MIENVFTAADPAHGDGEVNEQVIPVQIWNKLTRDYRNLRQTQMHRGRLGELFTSYLNGVADGLELDRNDLLERVKEVA